MDATKLKSFLAELSTLTLKYRIVIHGCGCCGSPFLEPLTPEQAEFEYEIDPSEDHLKWVKPVANRVGLEPTTSSFGD